jgi:glycerol-3-phosphate acyltransferase PlsY
LVFDFFWLAAGSYLLGSCPFSVWIGWLILKKDIRLYGDGNPGATNVFRAGNPAVGMAAVILDVGKGIPFVLLARNTFNLPPMAVIGVGFCAMLGHAFSIFLHFKGGKALAVTAGVIIALSNAALFWSFFLFELLYFIIMEDRPWLVLLTAASCLLYLFISHAPGWCTLFMLGTLTLFIYKQAREISSGPRLNSKLLNIFKSINLRRL